MATKIGRLGITNEVFNRIVDQVAEEASRARQAAYDATLEILSEAPTAGEIAAFLASLDMAGIAQLASTNPDAAADAMQQLRRGQ